MRCDSSSTLLAVAVKGNDTIIFHIGDGVIGKYDAKPSDKTVDWRDGVPIWDDSIASYKYKDFSDWFLEPAKEAIVTGVYI